MCRNRENCKEDKYDDYANDPSSFFDFKTSNHGIVEFVVFVFCEVSGPVNTEDGEECWGLVGKELIWFLEVVILEVYVALEGYSCVGLIRCIFTSTRTQVSSQWLIYL